MWTGIKLASNISENKIDRQSQTTSNRVAESHGSFWDSRVAETRSKGTGLPWLHENDNPVFVFGNISKEMSEQAIALIQ